MSWMLGMFVIKEVFLSRRAPHMHAAKSTFVTSSWRASKWYSGKNHKYELVGFSMVNPSPWLLQWQATWKQKS